MNFELEDSNVVLDGNDFHALKETTTNKNYFAERVAIDGVFNYGLVPMGTEVKISLSQNNINTPLLIDRVIAYCDDGVSDEIIFTLYRGSSGRYEVIGSQRFSNGQMSINFSDGIIMPDMTLGVKPTQSDAKITVYVKPVKILFEAVPNPEI